MQQEVDSTAAAPAVPTRGRFQYSLSTLMLVTVIVACVCAMFTMYRELIRTWAERQAAVEEVKKYRHNMGFLDITDPKMIYARGVLDAMPEYCSWRVYLPEGRKYQLGVATKGITDRQLPADRSAATVVPLAAGEHVIEASSEKDREGKWHLYVSIAGDCCINGIAILPLEAGGKSPYWYDYLSPSRGTLLDPKQSFYLLWLRKQKGDGSGADNEWLGGSEPADGVVIWIEERK